MSEVTVSKSKVSGWRKGKRGLCRTLEQTQRLLAVMVESFERQLATASEAERSMLLFGKQGLVTQMPKLMQLATQLASLQMELQAEEVEEESYPPISNADLKLLKAWLES